MYDRIVVGAARLSEDPSTSVLVLEGGPPDEAPEIAVARLFAEHYEPAHRRGRGRISSN